MAEQLKNSRTTPTCTLATSSITAGVTTTFDVSSASGLPASGTFRFVCKGAASNGSDDAIAVVGAISGVTCSSVTWEEVGSQTTFTSGAELVLDLTAGGLSTYVSDQVSTHAALTTAHAAATNLLHTTGAESKAGILSLTDQMKVLGGYSSGGQVFPDIIFHATDLKTGINGTTGGIDFYVWDGIAQYPVMSITTQYANLNVPLLTATPRQETSIFHDGATVSNPYVPVATTDPGHIACFPTTAGVQLDITLPDPYNNTDRIYIVSDNQNSSATYNIVVSCDDEFSLGTTVNGAASYTINSNGRVVIFKAQFNVDFSNADWKIIAIK